MPRSATASAQTVANVRPIIVKKIIDGGHDAHHGGAWKIAYADFVTAMMAFFLLMWLLGMTDEEKRKGLADYFAPTLVEMRQESAGADGVLGGDSLMAVENYPHRQGQTGSRSITIPRDSTGGIAEAARVEARENANFANVRQQIQQQLAAQSAVNALARHLRLTVTHEGLQIDLMDQSDAEMFAVGTDRLTPRAMGLVRTVAEAARGLPNGVIVRGHTDARAYRPGQAMNNWSLSAARAGATRNALADYGIAEARFTRIEGVADREPISPNDRFDPRNRRISITLARTAPVSRAAPPSAREAGAPDGDERETVAIASDPPPRARP